MKVRGMHDVATAQSLINRSLPSSRAQIVAQLARMEHERGRLQRELSMWIGKQQQTQGRLGKVQQHITALQRALEETAELSELPGSRERPDSPAPPRREIRIEY